MTRPCGRTTASKCGQMWWKILKWAGKAYIASNDIRHLLKLWQMEWREPFDFFLKFRSPLCKWYLRTLLFGILEQKVPKSVIRVQSYFLVHKTHCFWRSRCRSHGGYFCSLFPCTYCLTDWDNKKSKKMETFVDAVMEMRSCYWTHLTWKGRGL